MGSKKLRKEVKKEYLFVAYRNNAVRSFRIQAHHEAEAEAKAKTIKRYMEWSVAPYYGRRAAK